MSGIIANEPAHWHDAAGKHNMKDPRTIEGWPRNWWDSDERAYVTHLETHEGERTDPKPREADSPLVRDLFELLEAHRREDQSIRELIVAHRAHAVAKAALGG